MKTKISILVASLIVEALSLSTAQAMAPSPAPETIQWIQNSIRHGIRASEQPTAETCVQASLNIVATDPITFKPGRIRVGLYHPAPAAVAPSTILLFPPTGGENFMDDQYAANLCIQGFQVALMQRWDGDTDLDIDLGTFDRVALRTIAASEHVLEYLKPRREVGILGTSLGAIEASAVMGYDSRIKVGVLIVGGASLYDVVAHTDQEEFADLRNKQMAANGLKTTAEYEVALKNAIKIDNGVFAQWSGPKTISFYMGTEDTTVPTNDQKHLASLYSHAQVVEYPADHVDTIVHTFVSDSWQIPAFFQRNLR